MVDYEPIIGLEIHAELLTASKMFCGCEVVDSVVAQPNRYVCPICLGMPGMLPVINRRAVEMAMRVALALNCTIQSHNVFARKNYFYPDLPKSYQISQYELPLATNGWLEIETEAGARKRIGIRRVHMEEDTGKLTHVTTNDDGYSLIDFNRSGVPLLEIVSEPDMRSVEEARAYAVKVRQILRYLDVNSGDMERGVIRFEANVSLRLRGSQRLGTRTEIKNLNSFRSLVAAASYELERQAAVLEAGGEVEQKTLGWDEARQITYIQRSKEEAHDYRYFPEPDLPPLQISQVWIDQVRDGLPELPDARLKRYTSALGLSDYDAGLLAEDRAVAEWFDAALATGGEPKAVANWIINDLFRLMNEYGQGIDEVKIRPDDLVALIGMVDDGAINLTTARDVLDEMFATGQRPRTIVEERGLAQLSDEAALEALVNEVIVGNPDQVESYLGGKEGLRGWFVGQVMRATRGKGNPAIVNRLVDQALEERRAAS